MKIRASSIALLAIALGAGLPAVLMGGSSARPAPARGTAGQAPPPVASLSPSPGATAPGSESSRGSLRVVVQAGGKRIAGASVTLLHEATHRQMDFATRDDGTETVLALPAGDYHVGVCHPGFVFASLHRRVGGGAEELTVDLQQGARLEGRVVDGTGRALAGARVLFVDPTMGAPITHDLCARTDSTGSYRIDGIPEGVYDVQFRHDRHRSWVHPSLTVSAPGQFFQVDAVLHAGRRLTGRVVNEAGEPIPGATVVGSNEESVTARSGEGGAFALEGLGEAPVHCFASAPGYGIAFLRGVPAGAAGIELRLPRTATVSGEIEARPLPERFNVQLSLFDPDAAAYVPLYGRAFAGAAGREFDIPEVSPGRYRLEVQADGFEAQDSPELSVLAGRPLSGVQVRLRKRP